MRAGVIGIGQAGGRISDLLLYHSLWGKHKNIVPFALAVNTAQADLMGLQTIHKRNRILIGQTLVKGHGVGLNRATGIRIAQHWIHSVMHPVTENVVQDIDAFLVIAGLGGGTGSGAVPVVVSKLRQVYEEPVLLIGVLPSEDEGKLMTMNAVECLQELDGLVNGILLFDNDVWANDGRALDSNYSIMNYELVKPLPLMLGAGEAANDRVGVKVVDASDIINTWEGISYVGYSEMKAKTPRDRILFFRKKSSIDQLSPAQRCYTAVRNAATLRLTGVCEITEAKKALMIVAGPPDELNMEGFSHAKSWLENSIATSEVRGGDYPLKEWDSVAAVVLLSGYSEIPRLGIKFENIEVTRSEINEPE